MTDPEILRRIVALEEFARKPRAESAISGTFTPSLVGLTTPGTFTYDAANTLGNYTIIDTRLMFNFRLRITAIAVAPVGITDLNGLPLASASVSFGVAGGVVFNGWTGWTLTAGYTQLGGEVLSVSTKIRILQSGSAVSAGPPNPPALVGGVIDLRGWGWYQV